MATSSNVLALLVFTLGIFLHPSGDARDTYLQSERLYVSANPGGSHTCAIAQGGATYCWGANRFGQLGLGSAGGVRLTPQAVIGAIQFAHLAAGQNHNCGMTQEGDLYCWGYNDFGQLGNGSTTNSASPIKVVTNLKFVAVSAGFTHTCAIAQGGGVHCWGDGRLGQLGIGTSGGSITRPALAPIKGLTFVNIGAGGAFTCGRTDAGKLYCWGTNGHGELGAPSNDSCPSGAKHTPCSRTPVAVDPNRQFRFLSIGQGSGCATTNEGETRCWAWQFGTAPTPIAGAPSFGMLAVGSSYACGLDGADIRCWGTNSSGQLGNGSTASSVQPVLVAGDRKFASVRGGPRHACGTTTSLAMYCWGSNLDGQLGDGSTTDSSIPVLVR